MTPETPVYSVPFLAFTLLGVFLALWWMERGERQRNNRNLFTYLAQLIDRDAEERRGTQDRLAAALDVQGKLATELVRRLERLNAPSQPAQTIAMPEPEEQAEQAAFEAAVLRGKEQLLAEADRRGEPMSPDEAETIARDALGSMGMLR